MPLFYDHDHENEVVPFAETNFRNQRQRFGIKTDDRRRHVYLIGKTGVGKSTTMENMIAQDIAVGHGVALVDPHGDFAEKILDYIPSHRVNDVVYFNPADMEYPIGFNILETIDPAHKHLVAAGLMGVFKKIWPDVWSARMEYILGNSILALLDYPGSTLLGINRLLVDKEFRKRVIASIKDPVVKTFWLNEYSAWEMRFRNEAIAPIQNKVGQFLSASIIRNMVAQVKSTINIREIMDAGKIFIINLSKGRIGEENARLLGGMLITKMQLSAMERVDMPEPERRDFYLYVDEFQNFATESFANILSEARKYHLNLIMAHQYIEQLEDEVRAAVFGNVGTIVSFRVGAADAEAMAVEFAPRFTEEDLVNLTKYDVYLKLMIDGMASNPFSATTLPPLSAPLGNKEKSIRVSRERYSQPRTVIEEKILRWSGLVAEEGGGEGEKKEDWSKSEAPSYQREERPWKPPARRDFGEKRPPFKPAEQRLAAPRPSAPLAPSRPPASPQPFTPPRSSTPLAPSRPPEPPRPPSPPAPSRSPAPSRIKKIALPIKESEPIVKAPPEIKPISLSELAKKPLLSKQIKPSLPPQAKVQPPEKKAEEKEPPFKKPDEPKTITPGDVIKFEEE